MSTTRARQEAMLLVCAKVAQDLASKQGPALAPYFIARKVYDLAKIARSLHRRYAAACSYEWANTEAYEKRTESLELKAMQIGLDLGVVVTHQRDPRGWPLLIHSKDVWQLPNPDGHTNPSWIDGHHRYEIGRLG